MATGSLRIPSVDLAPPASLTHEGLAHAACPVCGVAFHMADMERHLTTVHRQLSARQCRRICQGRIALYQRVVGLPLDRSDGAGGAVAVPSVTSTPTTPTATVTTATVGVSPQLRRALETLPTVTPQGAYLCNWCVVRSNSHATRDAFLKHVIHDHPEVPLDDVEESIPLPSRRPPPPSQPSLSPQTSDGGSGHDSRNAAGWGVGSDGISSAQTAHWPAARRGSSGGGGGGGPTRRVQGVATVVEGAAPAASLRGLAARQSGITLPRGLDSAVSYPGYGSNNDGNGSASSAPALSPDAAAALAFTADCFPCELCGRAFETEMNLLQHLESKHPTGTITAADGVLAAAAAAVAGSDPSAFADVAQYQREEAMISNSQQQLQQQQQGANGFYALCDLCGSSKVYTLPSALYSHIRFKHPAEDAAFHVERMCEASKSSRPLVCPHCARGFATQEALGGHVADKHGRQLAAGAQGETAAAGAISPPSSSSSLPAVITKNRWWCNDCEKGFGQAKALHGHRVGKHQMQSQVFPCPACKRVFSDVHSLEEHFTAQHRGMRLSDLGIETHVVCPDCERLFLTREELNSHAARHHRKANQRKRAAEAAAAAAVAESARARQELEAPAVPRKIARRRSA